MDSGNRKEFAGIMAVLSELFDGSKEISEAKMSIYWESLKDFPLKDIKKAVGTIIRGRVYPSLPKPAEIIQAITGSMEERAVKAWIQVLETVKRIGPWQSVRFSDPVIHAVVEYMGGWPELGNMLSHEEKWKRQEFEKLYSIMSERGKYPPYLPGIIEIQNNANGYKEYIPDPIAIEEGGKWGVLEIEGEVKKTLDM